MVTSDARDATLGTLEAQSGAPGGPGPTKNLILSPRVIK